MAQFADRHAAERESIGLSKLQKPLDRFGNALHGRGRLGFTRRSRKMGGFFEQTGGVCINPHAMDGSLASELGLKFKPNFKGDGHWQPLSSLYLAYRPSEKKPLWVVAVFHGRRTPACEIRATTPKLTAAQIDHAWKLIEQGESRRYVANLSEPWVCYALSGACGNGVRMTITEILETGASIITSLGGGAAIVFGLSNYLGKRWADRALQDQRQEHARLNLELAHQLGLLTEQTKNALQMSALEHQVRFSKLHEERAQRIADLYGRIVELSVACARYVYQLGQVNRQEGYSELEKRLSDYSLFFDASQIYLPEHICILLENLVSALRKPVIGVFVYSGVNAQANDVVQNEKNETFVAAVKAFEAEIPAAKKALKDEFRKMLGVENPTSQSGAI